MRLPCDGPTKWKPDGMVWSQNAVKAMQVKCTFTFE